MDVLYSERSFRKYFNFLDKYKLAVLTDIMEQEEPFELRIAGLFNTLQNNSNKTQVQCCLYELADLLDKADSEQIKTIDEDIPDLILTNMNHYLTDVDTQRDGVFGLCHLMKDNQQIQNKLIKLRVHYCIVQRMFSFPNDVIIQAIGCRILGILVANNDQVSEEILAIDAVDAITNAIDTFGNEDDLQLWAMQALTHILQSNTEEQDKFLQREYCQLILVRAQELKEYSELIEQAFTLFTVLVESSYFMHCFSENELAVVFQFMKYHEDCRDVQYTGMCFLVELAKNKASHECLIRNNVDDIMLRAQANYPKCAAMQRKCIELLNLLCESLLDTENRESKAQQCLNSIMVAMASHWDDTLLLVTACESMSILCTHHPDLLHVMHVTNDEKDDHVPLHNSIMAALSLHIDNEKVCVSALMAIALSATQSSVIQKELCQKGVYIPIIKAMSKHSEVSEVQQYGCQSLRILSMSSMKDMTETIGSEAWEVVTRCIQSFKDEPKVLQEAIAIVACLSTDLDAIRNQCAVEKLYLPVLQAMQTFKDNETFIEMSFEFIGVITASEVMPDLLLSEGAVTTFLNAMNCHADHQNIQLKGCILIQVFSSYLTYDICIKAVSVIILAMQRFQFVECIQEEACVALKLIAQVSPCFSEILVNQCAHERLFVILDEFRTSRRLIELASGVLWFLGCSRMLNSRMLLSACADGLVRGAHCLIQLEADVNVGEGYNTPLCAACKNNKEEMVRFLLTQGIKDVHTALGLCLEMEHHNLVGLLLQKMGHDRESGIISWSGLNLGSVRPEWLGPSLSGKAFGLVIETERYCNYIQCAERAFKQRFKVLQKFTDLASVGREVNQDDIHRCIAETYSDGEEDDDCFFTSDEGSMTEEHILTQKVPLRARSLTGASLPYSSYDPRVVLPLNVGDPILLPRRSKPDISSNIPVIPTDPKQRRTENWLDTSDTRSDDPKERRTESCLDSSDTLCDETFSDSFSSQGTRTSTPVGKQRSRSGTSTIARRSQPDTSYNTSVVLNQRRTKSFLDTPDTQADSNSGHSDVDTPCHEFRGMAFMFHSTPYRRRRISDVSEESCEAGRKNSVGRRGRRKTAIFPRGQTDATVCVIDISKNSISDLSLLAGAGDTVLSYLFNVVKLDLSNNQLSDLPSELCEAMPNLKQVSLNNNNFKVFPFCLTEAPRLKILDISSNNLQLQDDPPDDASRSILLEHLSLANNHLQTFPKWLASFFPGLTSLSVSENELQEFPETCEAMQFLKTLDVSKNAINSIPASFLDQFNSLESLNASYNGLTKLPESQTDCNSNLTTLRLSHNKLTGEKPFFLPRFILRLPKLKVLDISYNQLTCLPSLETWKTTQLNQLDVSYNNIQRINLDTVNPTKWSSLERLNLRGNNLKDLPKGIGLMTSLTSLDLSDNPGITSLPDEMGRLSNLWDLPLSGLKLDLEESLVTNTKKLVAFFNSKLMNSVPYYRMKLVTVGLEKRGKTTLLNQLLRSKTSQSANELVIRDWTLRDNKATCKQCHHKSVIYTINTWDLKGREDMYQAFQCFMTSRTLYLAVYDVTNGGQEFEALRPWLQTIHACAPNVPVMMVGTHWDKVPSEKMDEVKNEMKDRARMLFSSPGLPDIKAHVVLNCTQETAGIQALRTSIIDLVVKCKCIGHSILGSRVPQKFVHLQELIERIKMADDRKGRWLTKLEIKRLLQDNDVIMTDSELGQAVKFLHEAGVLLHFDDPVAHLNDLFFTDPVWLNHLISSVVVACKHSKHSALVTNGIITKNGLIELIDDDMSTVVESFLPQFLRLLERFGVAIPIRESELLVPSRVQTHPPSSLTLPDLTSNSLYRRFYDLAFVPLGFWSRLITRLLLFLPMMDVDKNDIRYPSSVEYWKTGIQVNWSPESFFSVFQDTSGQFGVNLLAIAVPTNDQGSYLLGNLVDHVDALIEEWYPSLGDLDPVQGQPLVTRLCPCITCEGDTCHVFTLEECIEQALRYEEIVCPKTTQFLPVVKVAPDVELADLKLQNLLIEEQELALQQRKECVLGDGSFGTVYKAKCNDRVVAVKVFRTEGHIDPHRLLRQEVPFLAHLRHPSIITLHGVCVRPRALILEVAPLGSLSSLLNKGEVLSRGLQHRIALQVAEGLAFLHHNKIVYRDMKPHNILMFSLALSIVINAKISDFGIARYTTLYGLKSSEGTPGYRAPEVVRGDNAYNKEADLYSFGMLLYELVTGGRRPFEDVRFRNELDAAVMQGKMIDPITDSGSSPWPDIEDLIEHLLQPRADMRPTADQVVERLSNAELLCLKRTIAVSKGKAVECVAVRSDGNNVELWMGSGVSGHYGGQVSWLSLTQSTNEGCQGTFMKDKRVTSIAAVHNDCIIVGTQSGTIWVFDAVSRTCKHSLKVLPDSVVSLRHYYNSKTYDDVVLAGLANGSLVIYKTKDIRNANAEGEIMHLCRTINDGGSCPENCTVHAVACITIAKRSMYCGCGNDIVLFQLEQNSVTFKRRWSVEDRRNQCVLNISVGAFVWTSTKDSPYIDFWDISQPVLRGTINCATIISMGTTIPRNSRDMRIVCMLVEKNTLWVGLGTGHVIALSTKSRDTLYVLKRHTGPVRCLAIAQRSSRHGKPVSLLMTGGKGFVERPGFKSNDQDFGYVLVWEADLAEQKKRLLDDKTKRQQMQCTDLTENASSLDYTTRSAVKAL